MSNIIINSLIQQKNYHLVIFMSLKIHKAFVHLQNTNYDIFDET